MMKRTFRARVADVLMRALQHLPADAGYRIARRVVHYHNGDNDFDPDTNGETLVLRRVVPHARVVFDVGANVGDWTATALQVNRTASYHCFEPSRHTFGVLQGRNFGPNVRLNNAGLGRTEEERTLFLYGDASGANSVYHRVGLDAKQTETETIRLTTLDRYAEQQGIERIDFVKIDTEGHEESVFRGARGMLAAGRIAVAQFEYGGAWIDANVRLKDLFEFVASLNGDYSFYKVYASGPRLVPEYLQIYENYLYSNWLVVHRDAVPLVEGKR